MTRISRKGAASLNSTRQSIFIGVSFFLLALVVVYAAAWCYENQNILAAAILVCLLAALFAISVSLNSILVKNVEAQREDSQKALENLYRDLVKARDEALDAAKSKSAFLANMSHEIRTPMNAVIGCSDMLTRTPLNSEQKKLVDIILSSGSALVDIINDILVLSKLEAGKFDLQQEEIEIVTLVERTADLLAEKAESKQLSLTTFVAPEATSVVIGDAHRLRQILLNLLSNAVKFTEHGCIALRAEAEKIEEESIWIQFSVSDTGIGIAEENLSKLFKPFSQCDVSVTRRYGGTGLGLVISKKLTEVMGGRLNVRSETAVGSTFTVSIPFKLAQTQPEASHVGVLNGKRMLVVGTPFNEFEVIRNYSFVWGMACDYAPSGETAIRYIDLSAAWSKSPQYDVVLCNDDLCDWDTQTFAANVRARDRSIKTVMLSGLGGVDRAFELSLEGISATLSKPLHQSALLECILELFRKKSNTNEHTKFAPELLNRFSQALPPDACKRVLVVEDNPVNQEVATLQLSELGFKPLLAENGAEALKILAKTRVSLVLMDCQMPIMDGFETARRIRRSERGGQFRVPIIAMTASAMEGDRQSCLESGMDDYVTKPLTSSTLRELIEKWLLVALEEPAEQEESKSASSSGHEEEHEGNGHSKGAELSRLMNTLRSEYGVEASARLLDMFCQQVPTKLNTLEEAFTKRETSQVVAISHGLRGSCAALHVSDLVDLCGRIEGYGRKGQLDAARADFHMLMAKFDHLQRLIELSQLNSKSADEEAAMKCKIFIVEDNELTRTGLKVILNQIEEFEVIGQAGNGTDALTELQTSDADLVLVDIGLPGMNGIEMVRELKESNTRIKILMFTSHDDDHDMFEAFSAGADGYVVKHEFGKARLELAIRSVLDGKCWIDPGIARRVLKFAARHKQFSPVALVTDPLTLEEEAILSGAGCSNGVCAVEPAFLKRLQRFARRSS